MNKYRLCAVKRDTGSLPYRRHYFIRCGDSVKDVETNFLLKFPHMVVLDITLEEENIEEKLTSSTSSTSLSPYRQRSHFKARLCQIRNNLQSMTDSESPYLTHEEIIQLQRISCKVDNVISKFGMRTMDLKKEEIL